MKTFHRSIKDIKRNWHLLDASEFTLGRLGTEAARFLMGKQKVDYSAHLDSGDFVVVINSEKIKLTGKKIDQKFYRSHSGFPKGFKESTFTQVFEKDPTEVLRHAIFGMLPDNKIKQDRMGRLNLVVGSTNPFESKFKKNEEK